ncbi:MULTISPECIES: hypothetical protein [unclassified Thioalkalivibrio]|uniref:hypothetical protein n=1 Tax=unclassified Thioalkalivibrio TaxID=2621013 RepID=UPI00037F637E|nr:MULTISPECIES: hypothetical protein [unclassified Thioalkalivibrio]
MRWLILSLALLNLGYFAWVWHDGRLDPDPYADVPPVERNGGDVELLDVWLEVSAEGQGPDDVAGRERPASGAD